MNSFPRYSITQTRRPVVTREGFLRVRPLIADATLDADGDGVTNFEEQTLLLSPNDPDTRSTGKGDLFVLATRLLYPDGNAPADDLDGNGLPDWYDAALLGSNPFLIRVAPGDLDGDGMPDAWEHQYSRWLRGPGGLDLRMDDASLDADGDGLTNLEEYQNGTHPLLVDTDADGFTDGYEVAHGTDPSSAATSPLTLAHAMLDQLRQLAQLYLAASPGSAARTAYWNAMLLLKGQLLTLLDDMSQNTTSTEVQTEITDMEGDTGESTETAENTPSTAIVQWRWAASNFKEEHSETNYKVWIWNGSHWEETGGGLWESHDNGPDGRWADSDGGGGENETLADAQEHTQVGGEWQDAPDGDGALSASGHYLDLNVDEPVPTPPSDPPADDGEEHHAEGFWTTGTGSEYNAHVIEVRIRRSEDGDQDVPLSKAFVKTTIVHDNGQLSEANDIIVLELASGQQESPTTMLLEGDPESPSFSDANAAPQAATEGENKKKQEMLVMATPIKFALREQGTLTPYPEDLSHDEVMRDTGTDKLGELEMGDGRADSAGQAYCAPVEVTAMIPETKDVSTWRWKRSAEIARWLIKLRRNAENKMEWQVKEAEIQSIPDDGPQPEHCDVTRSTTTNLIYTHDSSGSNLNWVAVNITTIGDYCYEERQFTYKLEGDVGGVWKLAGTLNVGQKIKLRRSNTNSRFVKDDFEGKGNKNTETVLDLKITEDKVRAIVGGKIPITFTK